LPSVRAASVIKTKFRMVMTALRTKTQAIPRSAGLLRRSSRRPITSLNFTFTDLGRLFDAATQLLKPDSAPSSIREPEYARRAPAFRPREDGVNLPSRGACRDDL